MKNIFLIIAVIILIGCQDGDDGKDGTSWPGSDGGALPITVSSNPSGRIETAFCKKGTVVWATSVDASWTQTGALSGEVKTNDGSYVVRGNFAGPFISFLVPSGTCFNEAHNSYSNNVILRGMETASATVHNKNYATSLEYYIAEDHFFNPASAGYGDIPTAFTLAKSEILDYFNFPALPKGFNELSVVGNTLADAYLLALETYITDAGSGENQYDRLAELGIAILNADLIYRSTVRNFVADIKVKEVTDNIKNESVKLGFASAVAPLYNLPLYPSYYADLMGRTPTVLEEYQTTAPTCTIDAPFTTIAYPYAFTNTSSNYVALKTSDSGTFKIYPSKTCNQGTDFPCPDLSATPIDITRLREKLIDSNFDFNGDIEGTVTTANIWFVSAGASRQPSKGAKGKTVKFGSLLGSNDGGATWFGDGNTTSCFTGSIGVKTVD
jgi:hypothetical protein